MANKQVAPSFVVGYKLLVICYSEHFSITIGVTEKSLAEIYPSPKLTSAIKNTMSVRRICSFRSFSVCFK